jgi:hypothetical protein
MVSYSFAEFNTNLVSSGQSSSIKSHRQNCCRRVLKYKVCNTVQYCIHSMLQRLETIYCPLQFNAMQFNAIQYNTLLLMEVLAAIVTYCSTIAISFVTSEDTVLLK